MTKAELRTRFLAQRRSLSATAVYERSERIADQFFASLTSPFKLSAQGTGVTYLHAFLPIRRQHEIDTWLIINRLWQERPAVQVVVSRTDVATTTLTHYQLQPGTLLTENRWGIPEPDPTSSVRCLPGQLDLVLVPLLTFDRQGHRVGYGGGYYDRFLADCRPDCRKVGLSLFEPVPSIHDVAETDVRLDACVTPFRTYVFPG